MSGFGLESLIPKKGGVAARPPEKSAVDMPPPAGDPFAVKPQRSVPPPVVPSPRAKQTGGSESIFQIEVHLIKPNPYQPRRDFNGGEIEELAASIRQFGMLQPIVVSKTIRETERGAAVGYELIAGERRFLAAKRLGFERVPAVVRNVDERRAKLELSLIENIQRSALSPLETARAYARLQDEFGLAQREIAVRMGKSREVVANTLRLLNLPPEFQRALAEGAISESQARALLSAGDAKAQDATFHDFLIRRAAPRAPREAPASGADPQGAFWERKLEEKFGAPVRVVKRGGRGKIEMRFQSEEEWRALTEKLGGGEDAE